MAAFGNHTSRTRDFKTTPLKTAALPVAQLVIAGAGVVGLGLAIALKQALGSAFTIVMVDPAIGSTMKTRATSTAPDHRAYAIAASARRMLTTLGVWEAILPHSQPIHEMIITDSRTHDVVRPVFLTFAEERAENQPFAQIVIADVLQAALEAKARALGVVMRGEAIMSTKISPARVEATLSSGEILACRILIAADGAKSKLRQEAGIGWIAHDYAQSGIVATLQHERTHEGRAVEHFMPGGPFAILPLPDDKSGQHRSSIVWSEPGEKVDVLLSLPAPDFTREVETRFGLELGEIALLDKPRAFPLSYGLARRFVSERLALVGDAAHIVHPIAGQGLNLGLKDVASLAEVIVDAARLGLDIGAATVLESYERARRADTVIMGMGMDLLNKLFSNDVTPLRLARDLGLGLVDRLPALKRRFIAQAAGETDAAPRLMRGERL